MDMEGEAAESFAARFKGGFSGVLRWWQLDELWRRVRAYPRGWYIYFVGQKPPVEPVSVPELDAFLTEVDSLLRREHKEDYCGIVYADDRREPSMIKIYDPGQLGASCGSSGLQVLPRWVLSRLPPARIDDPAPAPRARLRWWRGLFGGPGA